MKKVRMNVEFSPEVAELLEQLATEEATTKAEILRRAVSVLKAYRNQKSLGRNHIGFTSSPENLDAELVGILDR